MTNPIFDLTVSVKADSGNKKVHPAARNVSDFGQFRKVMDQFDSSLKGSRFGQVLMQKLQAKTDATVEQKNVAQPVVAPAENAQSQASAPVENSDEVAKAIEQILAAQQASASQSGQDSADADSGEWSDTDLQAELFKALELLKHGQSADEQDETKVVDSANLLPVVELAPIAIAFPQLNQQQQAALQELNQLIGHVQALLNGQSPLDFQQVKTLLAKLMNLLQKQADWMEHSASFKQLPVGQLMLALNQMLTSGDSQFANELQKRLESFQRLLAEVSKNGASVANAAIAAATTTNANADTSARAQTSGAQVNAGKADSSATGAESGQPSTVAANAAQQAQATQQAQPTTVQTPQVNAQTPTREAQPQPQASATPQTFTPQQLPQEIQKMMKMFRFNRINGASEARLALNPEHLGHVNVKISVQNGLVVAQIYTDTAAAKESIEAQLMYLRASLQSSGLMVERLEVHNNTVLSQQFHDQQRQQTQQQSNKQGKQRKQEFVDLNGELEQAQTAAALHRAKMGTTFEVTA